jgi:NNP family nitrate/nitrite transporter-like MFS transporter
MAPGRSRVRTAVALLGVCLVGGAWPLYGMFVLDLRQRHPLDPVAGLVLVAIPLAVCGLVAIPAGALTDRFGARYPLAAVTIAAALALSAAATGTIAGTVAAGAGLGIGGAAFAIGAGLVTHGPPARHGVRLNLLGPGLAAGALTVGLVRSPVDPHGLRSAAAVLAVTLVAVGVVVVLAVRDHREPVPVAAREVQRLLRLRTTRQMCLLAALTVGGLLAVVPYLPAYTHLAYGDGTGATIAATLTVALAAAVASPVGAALVRRQDPTRVMLVCYACAATLGILVAFTSGLAVPAGVGILAATGFLGAAGGALLGVLGYTVPFRHAGALAGTLTAAACGSGLLAVLLIRVAGDPAGSPGNGPMLLTVAAVAAAVYLHARAGQVVGPLVFPVPSRVTPGLDKALTVVVAVPAATAGRDDPVLVGMLADLARRHELVIVCADAAPAGGGLDARGLVTSLRVHLPRQSIVAVLLDADPGAGRPEPAFIAQLVADGVLPVAAVPDGDPTSAAAGLATHLGAEMLLRVTRADEPTRVAGA